MDMMVPLFVVSLMIARKRQEQTDCLFHQSGIPVGNIRDVQVDRLTTLIFLMEKPRR